ncbi:SulP family inorganic anion transporter [Castellaniella sp. GW247-6E4]|uniref:SulP family inorganic anion transporter n=1 Tax=Castellaniella sp. GW247-6E4 TaxID=3140380 RepID=UPI003315A149
MAGSRARRLLPFLQWPRPTAASLRKDAWAGLSVALVLIPQSLAYATLAGMPPETGLYAAMLPAVVGILWGSSSLLAVGPVALTSLLTSAVLLPLAAAGGSQWVALAIWLAVYSGLIQLALGVLRLGAIAHVVSDAVITGFINAAAMIIILSQIPPLLGLPPMAFNAGWPLEALAALREAPLPVALTSAFGVGALCLLALQRRYAPRLPGVLLVCVGGIVVSGLGHLAEYGIGTVGTIPQGVPGLQAPPAITASQHVTLLSGALIIALISFTEAMSSCRILSKKFNTPWSENQELIGQGLAKIASGFSGAFPVSGSFSRSALNAYVGATSGWSALFASVCIFACLLWATGFLFHLPRAILAAIIIAPVTGLINLRAIWRSVRATPADGLVALATFVATLVSTPALHWGVLGGLAASACGWAWRRFRPPGIAVIDPAGGATGDRPAASAGVRRPRRLARSRSRKQP